MTTEPTPRLRLRGISKRYGAVRVIANADVTVRPGTVHALVGENGAGKSTVIKVVSGAVAADTGTVEFDGTEVQIASTNQAMDLGIATVYQEPQMFAELSVAENVFLGREIRRGARIDWARQYAQVVDLLARLGLPANLAMTPAGDLSIAEQQQVSIAKALAGEARLLILDEPSAILTDAEIEVLFEVVRKLTDEGVAVVYISHRLDELKQIADDVTIMRDGDTIGTYPVADLSVREIAEKMVGGILNDEQRLRTVTAGATVLELRDLGLDNAYDDVSLTVRAGEILGLYGLVGSGVAEIADTVYGMRHAARGSILINGKDVRPTSPRHAKRMGLALLPSDRKRQGMFAFQSISFNLSIGHLKRLSKAGWVDRTAERQVSRDLISRLAVRTPNEKQHVAAMSGGNAQKVVLARQLVDRPDVLVLVEPTQGVDVGAKDEIHRIVSELADAGTAVLVVTSDLPEGLRISDRLLVVRAGRIAAEFSPEASQVEVLAAAAGGGEEDVA